MGWPTRQAPRWSSTQRSAIRGRRCTWTSTGRDRPLPRVLPWGALAESVASPLPRHGSPPAAPLPDPPGNRRVLRHRECRLLRRFAGSPLPRLLISLLGRAFSRRAAVHTGGKESAWLICRSSAPGTGGRGQGRAQFDLPFLSGEAGDPPSLYYLYVLCYSSFNSQTSRNLPGAWSAHR